MKSMLRIISGLMLLTGLGFCGLWLFASVLGKVTPDLAWDAVVIVGLPIAAVGAVGSVLTGQLRDQIHRLLNT